MGIYFWIGLLISFVVFTYLMKFLFKAKTYISLLSMISSTKSVVILDKFKNNTFWFWIAKFGIFLGFGLAGILFWYSEDLADKTKFKKTLIPVVLYTIAIFIIGLFISAFLLFKSYSWTYFLNVFVFTILGFAGFGILLLIYQAYMIISAYIAGRVSCPGVAPVIPGITIPGTDFKVPFFEGWIALIVIMVVHELAHGVLARKVGIKVKSLGLLLLGFFPIGAFTEPDEEQLKKAKPKDQMLVYSAGPVLNLALAFIVFLFVFLIFTPLAGTYLTNIHNEATEGLYVIEFSKYTGICNLGVESENNNALNPLYAQLDTNEDLFFKNYSLKLVSINDENIPTTKSFSAKTKSLADLNVQDANFIFSVQDVNKTKEGFSYSTVLKLHSDDAFGLKGSEKQKEGFETPFAYDFLLFISTTLFWVSMLSFMVGLFNFIPIKPLDGGAMLEHISVPFIPKKYNREKGIKIVKWFFIIVILGAILINALPLFI